MLWCVISWDIEKKHNKKNCFYTNRYLKIVLVLIFSQSSFLKLYYLLTFSKHTSWSPGCEVGRTFLLIGFNQWSIKRYFHTNTLIWLPNSATQKRKHTFLNINSFFYRFMFFHFNPKQSMLKILQGDSLLLNFKFQGIPAPHLINLSMMKDWNNFWATLKQSRCLEQDPLIKNPAP